MNDLNECKLFRYLPNQLITGEHDFGFREVDRNEVFFAAFHHQVKML